MMCDSRVVVLVVLGGGRPVRRALQPGHESGRGEVERRQVEDGDELGVDALEDGAVQLQLAGLEGHGLGDYTLAVVAAGAVDVLQRLVAQEASCTGK